MKTLKTLAVDRVRIETVVAGALRDQPIVDLHTHCYSPRFGASPAPGGLLLWGIDELLTYHYLVAEVFRVVPPEVLPYERFWAMPKAAQADHIWRHLFVERTPLSEACRGVLTTLASLGLEPGAPDLAGYRKWFAQESADRQVDRVLEISGVRSITMTNPVFDDHERAIWLRDPSVGADPRFRAVLRIDPLLCDWPAAARALASWGFGTREDFSGKTLEEVQRFLREWIDRMKAVYVAASLPPEWRFPGDPATGGRERPGETGERILRDALLPALRERDLPLAMMIGARRGANPDLREAGDVSGIADVGSVARMCREFPGNRFLVTMLARENQHELCVVARKFPNLLVFGCWWFLNNPSLIEEITRLRLELLGTSFVPQHSDARILEQLIYKWDHTRRILGKVLADKYSDLAATGFPLGEEHIRADARRFLSDNFLAFLGKG